MRNSTSPPPGAEPTVRSTRQRRAVSSVLAEVEEFRSAQDIHEELRRSGDRVGLSTVYRTLQAMADAGDVDVVRNDAGEALYRRCSDTHHHHLMCRVCGRTVEVEGPAFEAWTTKVSREHGYRDVSHTLELVGTCADCAGS